jgi:hypothetical protein
MESARSPGENGARTKAPLCQYILAELRLREYSREKPKDPPAFPSFTDPVYPRLIDRAPSPSDLKNVSNSTMTRMAFCGPRRTKDAKRPAATVTRR